VDRRGGDQKRHTSKRGEHDVYRSIGAKVCKGGRVCFRMTDSKLRGGMVDGEISVTVSHGASSRRGARAKIRHMLTRPCSRLGPMGPRGEPLRKPQVVDWRGRKSSRLRPAKPWRQGCSCAVLQHAKSSYWRDALRRQSDTVGIGESWRRPRDSCLSIALPNR
jgi:hypothetical protein